MAVEIVKVSTKKQLKQFIRFNYGCTRAQMMNYFKGVCAAPKKLFLLYLTLCVVPPLASKTKAALLALSFSSALPALAKPSCAVPLAK